MSWITFSSVADVAGLGSAMLQYDDTSTGTLRDCRLQFELNPGASIYVYFNNVLISGGQAAAQVLVTGTTTVWTGQLTAGRNESFQFTCPWSSGSVTYSGSGTLPSGTTAPTGLAISNRVIGPNSLTATVSVTGWGGAGDANTRYRNLAVWSGPDSTYSRKALRVYGDELSSEITIDNSVSGSLASIEPNTRYWYYASASNGTASDTTSFTSFVTKPAVATISVTSTTETQATVSYSLPADGGFYFKKLQYSLDNGATWNDVVEVAGGDARSGVFTISGLIGATLYVLKTRVRNAVGDYTMNSDVIFATSGYVAACRNYGSVNGASKEIDLFYGSVNSQSKLILKIYGSEGGVARRIF